MRLIALTIVSTVLFSLTDTSSSEACCRRNCCKPRCSPSANHTCGGDQITATSGHDVGNGFMVPPAPGKWYLHVSNVQAGTCKCSQELVEQNFTRQPGDYADSPACEKELKANSKCKTK